MQVEQWIKCMKIVNNKYRLLFLSNDDGEFRKYIKAKLKKKSLLDYLPDTIF